MSMGKKLMHWVDARFPATETYEYHMSKYYAPKNFNFWYFFGVFNGGIGQPIGDWYLANDDVQPKCRRGICLC